MSMPQDRLHPLASFWSPEPTARIEPTDFMEHVLAYRGVERADVGLRQTVLLAFLPELERRVLRAVGAPTASPHSIQRQILYNPVGYPFSVLASPMGASMAAMLLEQLIALGARHFLYLGFCGALDATYHIGDCLIPVYAMREEGTSYHYLPADVVPTATPHLTAVLQAEAQTQQVTIRQGPIWTTDAPYRETEQKIRHFQAAGVHAVDMEMAALFAVAAYRRCAVTALLIVSDECYHPIWKPGFGAERLRQGCRQAVAVAVAAATRMATVVQDGDTTPQDRIQG